MNCDCVGNLKVWKTIELALAQHPRMAILSTPGIAASRGRLLTASGVSINRWGVIGCGCTSMQHNKYSKLGADLGATGYYI